MSTEAKSPPPPGAAAILTPAAPACALAQTAVIPALPSIARPPHTSTGVRPAGSRRLSPSLIVRTWHHRPGRGPACPDKETP
jgi:hypothetical protein